MKKIKIIFAACLFTLLANSATAGLLHNLAARGHLWGIEYLKNIAPKKFEIQINEPDANGKTPLALAHENGAQDVAQFLITHGAKDTRTKRKLGSGNTRYFPGCDNHLSQADFSTCSNAPESVTEDEALEETDLND